MNATERAEILDMLAAGKISAAEAMRLLDQAGAAAQPQPAEALKREAGDIPVEDVESEIKIDAPEPAALKSATPVQTVVPGNGGKPRWLKIRVRDRNSDRNKVTVTLPLGLVSFGLGMARRFGADMGEVEVDEVMSLVKAGERGMLVEVDDEEDGDHVQIYLD